MSLSGSRAYRLARHVHACRIGSDLVLLDLRRDRYLGMDALDEHALHSRIAGLPAPSGKVAASVDLSPELACPPSDTKGAGLLSELLELEMLTRDLPDRDVRDAASIERPEIALIDGYADIRATVRFRDFVTALIAVMTAAALLRACSLERIVRRLDLSHRHLTRIEFDPGRARQKLAAFNRLRPLLYSEGDACLLSSLSIHEYLARDRLFPRLVFGVATRPFRAHCWLQHGEIVVNDTPENVREYTPILVV